MATNRSRFDYAPAAILHGEGSVADLGHELERRGKERALIVTGRTVGAVEGVIDPIKDGLGDRLVDIFDEVTPAKTLGTAANAAEIVRDRDIDCLVGVGGGGTLDTTKQISVLSASENPTATAEEMIERGGVAVPDDRPLRDIVAIPTTLAGADLSIGGGVGLSMETEVTAAAAVPGDGVSDPRLMPAAVFYDATIVATTPPSILARSAMNGYDKGIEMLYARDRTPVTDATAIHGLRLLQSALPVVRDEDPALSELSRVLEGMSLVQYGRSTPHAQRISIIHAFGHALTATYPIQQGVAHAIAAPPVLRYLFDEIDARRELLATALGVADVDDPAGAVVDAVSTTRDSLALPKRLRSIDGADREDFPDMATAVLADSFMDGAPVDLDPTTEDIVGVFEAMW